MKQFLIIGDIIGSRGYEGKDLWVLFNKVVKKTNKNFTLKYNLQITLGDEFQGVCDSVETSKEIIRYFQKQMRPVRLRFVVVPLYGDLSLVSKVSPHFNPLNTAEMMVAQDLMRSLKKGKKKVKIKNSLSNKTLKKHATLLSLDYTNASSFDVFKK